MTDDGRTVEGGLSPAETRLSDTQRREGCRRLPVFEFWKGFLTRTFVLGFYIRMLSYKVYLKGNIIQYHEVKSYLNFDWLNMSSPEEFFSFAKDIGNWRGISEQQKSVIYFQYDSKMADARAQGSKPWRVV